MPTLEVLPSVEKPADKQGEVFACGFTQDGDLALTGGWDGHLRLWETDSGRQVAAFPAAVKPLSACTVSPDGKQWLSGSMDGVLSVWDPVSHQQMTQVLAHTRPIAGIAYSTDGQTIATAGWDRKVSLRSSAAISDGRTLIGHSDLVAGCRFLPDSVHLMSWSHDGSVRIWDIATGSQVIGLTGHSDRVNYAAVSPDGKWIVSATRDRQIKLWEWQTKREIKTITINAEPRALFFLADGTSIISVDAEGWITLYVAPNLVTQEEIETGLAIQCAELAPKGTLIALGCTDGRVRFVNVAGVESAPLHVAAMPTARRKPSPLGFLFGKQRARKGYAYTCPACRQPVELDGSLPGTAVPCPQCGQSLRLNRAATAVVQNR